MQLHLHVTFNTDADPVDVVTSLFDIVKLERKYDIPATKLASEMRFEWLAFLAREAMRSDGHTVPAALDEFIRNLEGVDVVEVEADRPTEPAAAAT